MQSERTEVIGGDVIDLCFVELRCFLLEKAVF